MADSHYPEYVERLLAEARALVDGGEAYDMADAAAICFDVLALFPDSQEAADLAYRAFSNPWLIRDNRKAVGRHIDEWDDRPWQQRRRLALSFRFMSRWEGRHRKYLSDDPVMPEDVKAMLEEGRGQLLQDYLMGQSRGSEMAWPIFQDAINRTDDPALAILWVGHLYADHGFFAESVEILADLLERFPRNDEARRLWAEVRWWRDHQDRIPWIPPATAGRGRRFLRIMGRRDPEVADDPNAWIRPWEHLPPKHKNLPEDFRLPRPLPEELISGIEEALGEAETADSDPSLVDWSYLDQLESDHIDVGSFPAWAQYMLRDIDNPEEEAYLKQFLLSYLANPPIPPKDDEDE